MCGKHRKTRLTAALAGVLILIGFILPGCVATGPDYVRPEVKMPGHYSPPAEQGALTETDEEALAAWWNRLGDPVLTGLVERSLTGNLGLKEAAARIREVRARKKAARAGLLPALTGSGNGSTTQRENASGKLTETRSFSAGFDVSWEIDLFGGTRRGMEAAEADFQAAREDYRDVMVSLTAETASAYVQLRTYQKRLELARKILALMAETAELTGIKYDQGLAGALDVEQATYNLESTRSQIPELEANIQEMKNRLSVLLGGWPGDLAGELSAVSPIPATGLETAVGVPADLIRRRPDIRGAEQRLVAQTARVGEAKADLYPKLTLSGSLGWEALALGGLISPANMVAAVGAGISWSIFKQGSVRAQIEIEDALQEQALIEYETVLRTAVEEVENALVGLVKESRKQESLAKAVKAAREASDLALREYKNGLSDFQKVLETQQSLASFEDQMAASRGQAALNLITMYKAVGGGWSATPQ